MIGFKKIIGFISAGLFAVTLLSSSASAATLVVDNGGPYDITSDTLFFGIASASSTGPGSWQANFVSPVNPLNGIAAASVTLNVLGLFTDLTVSWVSNGNGSTLASTLLGPGITSLSTAFSNNGIVNNLSQQLVFSWTSATVGAGFDFEVTAVPLPAGGVLLLSAFGGIAMLRRRRKPAT